MERCPHCGVRAISLSARFRASAASPAICPSCGQPCSVNPDVFGLLAAVLHIALIAGAVASLWLWSWLPIAGSALLYVVAIAAALAWGPLKALPAAEVRASRAVLVVVLLAIGVMVLAVVVLH